jgi:hypothetical protein
MFVHNSKGISVSLVHYITRILKYNKTLLLCQELEMATQNNSCFALVTPLMLWFVAFVCKQWRQARKPRPRSAWQVASFHNTGDHVV